MTAVYKLNRGQSQHCLELQTLKHLLLCNSHWNTVTLYLYNVYKVLLNLCKCEIIYVRLYRMLERQWTQQRMRQMLWSMLLTWLRMTSVASPHRNLLEMLNQVSQLFHSHGLVWSQNMCGHVNSARIQHFLFRNLTGLAIPHPERPPMLLASIKVKVELPCK